MWNTNMIEQKVENVTQQDFTLAGCLKQVEKTGRICYKSEDKISNDSYKAFTEMLIKNKHFSPFGHGTLILDLDKMSNNNSTLYSILSNHIQRFSSRYSFKDDMMMITSLRPLIELSNSLRIDFLKEIKPFIVTDASTFFDEDDYLIQRITIKCTTSIAMTRELNRHAWSLDITEQSTRYVKAGEFIQPYWYAPQENQDNEYFLSTINNSFDTYNNLIKHGYSKQQARDLLPLCTATEVYYTAFRYQWNDIINKRTEKGVHPQMINLINKIKSVL